MAEKQIAGKKCPGPFELFVLALCLYAVIVFVVEIVYSPGHSTLVILGYADTMICVVFLTDFFVSLARAESRWQYLYCWGWVDLLSSIPAIPVLRIGRVARIVRIIRLLRGFKATRILTGSVFGNRAETALLAAALVTILVISIAAIAILHFEATPEANIRSPQDAVWWAIVTITTIGYGDRYPVTTNGRVVAVVLMVVGVGLFGTFAGFIAAWLFQPSYRMEASKLEELEEKIEHLEKEIEKSSRTG